MRSDIEIQNLLKDWFNFDLKPSEKEQLEKLKSNKEELYESFYEDLSFGTAGIRGIVGLGSNRLNRFNIRKATYALGKVALEQENELQMKAVISYDSRLSSLELVKESCEVLLELGFKVFLMSTPTATPILSYAVRDLECDLGIMMTASHNPLNYNGFKAYLNDGKQIGPPFDQKVIDLYRLADCKSIKTKVVSDIFDHSQIEVLTPTYYESYFKRLKNSLLFAESFKTSDMKTVYTPLHGTGGIAAKNLMSYLGYKNLFIVKEQEHPNGEFPTTDFPNPESPASLEYAVKLMLEINAEIAIGSDPDADRMGVVLNDKGRAHYLNGNEIANLMLYYKLSTLKNREALHSNMYVVSTIVSSPMQARLCQDYGVTLKESLTGFRWICEVMNSELNEKNFIFASEESFGSLTHPYIRDKDGISSLATFIEMTHYYKKEGNTILDVLFQMYKEHGFFREGLLNLVYQGSEGKDKIQRLMSFFSESNLELSKTKVTKVSNYLNRTSWEEGEVKELDFPVSSNVLSFFYDNGLIIHVRPSGTEPKIKFYIQMRSEREDTDVLDEKISLIKKEIEAICEKI